MPTGKLSTISGHNLMEQGEPSDGTMLPWEIKCKT